MTPLVRYELEGAVARITLAHPEKRNILSFALVDALNDALGQAAAEPRARVVLLSAEGSAFCAGMDLKSVALDDPEQAARFSAGLAEAYRRLLMLPVPLLAAVDGPAMGGAVGLALAADLLWVGPKAKFAFPETKVGLVPALVSVAARRRMSPGKLAGMALTGIPAGPEDALRLGLADFISTGSALEDAEAFAIKIVRENSGEAMRRTKAFLQTQFAASLDVELADAQAEFAAAVATDACKKGLEAFRTKTAPEW